LVIGESALALALFCLPCELGYSLRIASIGLIWAARQAGKNADPMETRSVIANEAVKLGVSKALSW